jgi:hypothetical protein
MLRKYLQMYMSKIMPMKAVHIYPLLKKEEVPPQFLGQSCKILSSVAGEL